MPSMLFLVTVLAAANSPSKPQRLASSSPAAGWTCSIEEERELANARGAEGRPQPSSLPRLSFGVVQIVAGATSTRESQVSQQCLRAAFGDEINVTVVAAKRHMERGRCSQASACYAGIGKLKLESARDSPYDITLLMDTDVFAQPNLVVPPRLLLLKVQRLFASGVDIALSPAGDFATTLLNHPYDGAISTLGGNGGFVLVRKNPRTDRFLSCTVGLMETLLSSPGRGTKSVWFTNYTHGQQSALTATLFDASPTDTDELRQRPAFASLHVAWLHPLWTCRHRSMEDKLCLFVHARAALPEAERACSAAAPPAPKPAVAATTTSVGAMRAGAVTQNTLSTLRAATVDPVAWHRRHEPPEPRGRPRQLVLVLGFSKAGTMSLHEYFRCSAWRSSHFACEPSPRCWGDQSESLNMSIPDCAPANWSCASCLLRALDEAPEADAERRLRTACGGANSSWAITELGFAPWMHQRHIPRDPSWRTCVQPQVTHLPALLSRLPHACFVLNARPVERWLDSLRHWASLGTNLLQCNGVPASPSENCTASGRGWHEAARRCRLRAYYEAHVARVRHEFARRRSEGEGQGCDFEIDIESNRTGEQLARAFPGTKASCWDRAMSTRSGARHSPQSRFRTA